MTTPSPTCGAIATTATTSCTDTIAPGDSAYDNVHAAEDIERLRTTWDVPALALLGVGNGAQVALAYAGSHPDKVARLVLDSPLPLAHRRRGRHRTARQGRAGRARRLGRPVRGRQLPTGPRPQGRRRRAAERPRAPGNGPGGASVAAVADAISTALAYPQRRPGWTATNELARAVADASSGDTNQLNNLINQAETLRQTDGQFVNKCSDALNRPTPDRVRELVVEWGKLYPQFGAVGALDMVKCLNWPSGTAPPGPAEPESPTCCCSACRTTRSSATRGWPRWPRP